MTKYEKNHSQGVNMNSYQNFYQNFNLQDLKNTFFGDFDSSINPAIECCDRYAHSDKIALYYEGLKGEKEAMSFARLKSRSNQIANFLTDQGIKKGDTVAVMLPRTPELLAIIIGVWKLGAIYQPLFTAFGPQSIDKRLDSSHAKLLITDEVNRFKCAGLKNKPTIVTYNRKTVYQLDPNDIDYFQTINKYPISFEPVPMNGDDIFVLLSTSGTTGNPKPVGIPVKAMLAFKQYMDLAVDLRQEDRFWNLADPGWAYGIYYSVIGPLVNGNALFFYEGGFDAIEFVRVIDEYGITNIAGSPTAYRLLIGAGKEVWGSLKGKLRAVSSAGEPLNPEVIRFFKDELDVLIKDHYGQTELGMLVNNHHALEHHEKPGSMGHVMPGYKIAVLDDHGNEVSVNTPGILAVDMENSPILWFHGYHQVKTPAIKNGHYLTGDTVEMNEDGMVTYVGRNDDVITSSGYRIGPFDVESALMEHPAVLEVAVVGKPDPERTEIVKAFIVLGKDFTPSAALKEELSLFVKKSLAAHAYPREIEFLNELPKTPSGKVQRYILRSQEKRAS